MLEHGVSALLISPAYGKTQPTFDAIAQARIPTMQVLRKADNRSNRFPFYSMDYETGSHLAVKHLLNQSITAIAFAGGVESAQIIRERMSGYTQLMQENGLEQNRSFTVAPPVHWAARSPSRSTTTIRI